MPGSRIASRLPWSLLGIAAFAAISIAVGIAFEPEWGWICFALLLLALLASHLRHLYLLGRWLEQGEAPEPPRLRGVWDELLALMHRSRREAARREAALAEALTRWREAARALPDGVVILEDERIAWCNDTARLHLQLDATRDAGTPIAHLVRIPEFTAYLEGGDYARPIEVRPPHVEGRLLSLQVVAYGEGQRLLLTRDITQLERLERVRREFVANVSHEMRTPLTVISGFLETLREEQPDPATAARYIELMRDQAQRMQRLVEDLLTLSALESSPPPPMEEAIDVKALIERLGADARALSGGRHRIEAVAESDAVLFGTEKEITSAFGNLVSNAIRYTPEGGTVRVSWRQTPEGAAFDVEDTGIGIAAEHIPRLTERFYRVDRGRSRESGGTGLGLAIVKHALGRHGATLQVTSTPGKGSRFSAQFTGPRVHAPTPVPRPVNVLFLCTGNSARSIIAEAVLNKLGEGRFRAFSAGSHPVGRVNPLTLEVLADGGYSIAGLRSKGWGEFTAPGAPKFDFVVTVCASAASEACPVFPGAAVPAHWDLRDPAAVEGAPEAKRRAFEETLAILARHMQHFMGLPFESVDAKALRPQVEAIGSLR